MLISDGFALQLEQPSQCGREQRGYSGLACRRSPVPDNSTAIVITIVGNPSLPLARPHPSSNNQTPAVANRWCHGVYSPLLQQCQLRIVQCAGAQRIHMLLSILVGPSLLRPGPTAGV